MKNVIDDFEMLFGARLDEDDEPSLRSSRSPVVAEVLAYLGGDAHAIRLPDGRHDVLHQDLFRFIAPGTPLVLFPEQAGGWSLLHPSWEPLKEGDHTLARGRKLRFVPDHYDPDQDALLGHIGSLPAIVERACLVWPYCYRGVDLTRLCGTTLKLHVIDHTARPIPLASQVLDLPPRLNLRQLYCLAELARHRPLIPVRSVGGNTPLVEVLGLRFLLFPEDRSWRRSDPPLLPGQIIQAHLSVDLFDSGVYLSLRHSDQPEWAEVRRRYPKGTLLSQVEVLAKTIRGVIVHVSDPELDIYGCVPVPELSPLPQLPRQSASLPLPLQVIGHDEVRCALILGLAAHEQKIWATAVPGVDSVIPIQVLPIPDDSGSLGLWGFNALARTTLPTSPGPHWARVVECDPARRELEVEVLDTERQGLLERAPDDRPIVRFEDGVCAEVILLPDERPTAWNERVATTLCEIELAGDGTRLQVCLQDGTSLAPILQELARLLDSQEPLDARIVARSISGFTVDVGVPALLPFSQFQTSLVQNPEEWIGQTVKVQVKKISPESRTVIVTRLPILQLQAVALARTRLSRLQEGQIVDGLITNIVDYGAFINVNGSEGLLHVSEMSYGTARKPTELFRIGETIRVRILRIDEKNLRLNLGYKCLQPDPWAAASEHHPPGAHIFGRVLSIPDNGLLIELEDSIKAFIPLGELSWSKQIKHGTQLVVPGQEVEAIVLAIHHDEHRLLASMRLAQPNPWVRFHSEHAVGEVLRGEIQKICDFGLFVRIGDCVEGLLHRNELGWTSRTRDLLVEFPKGEAIDVCIVDMDLARQHTRLSVRALIEEPAFTMEARYTRGEVYRAWVIDDAPDCSILEMEDGLRAELSSAGRLLPQDAARDTELRVRVLALNTERRCLEVEEVPGDTTWVSAPPPPRRSTPVIPADLWQPAPAEPLTEPSLTTPAPPSESSLSEPVRLPWVNFGTTPSTLEILSRKSSLTPWSISTVLKMRKPQTLALLGECGVSEDHPWEAPLHEDLRSRLLLLLETRLQEQRPVQAPAQVATSDTTPAPEAPTTTAPTTRPSMADRLRLHLRDRSHTEANDDDPGEDAVHGEDSA